MDGIEPHWNKIRPLVLDSANQFQPKAPLSFNLTKGSPFQIQLQEVYEVGIGLSDEQVEIAKFWDCNPYVFQNQSKILLRPLRMRKNSKNKRLEAKRIENMKI